MKIFLKDNPNLNNKVFHNILPSEYQEVEYIESTGEQYINLNYLHKTNTRVETIFEISTKVGSFFFGSKSGANSYNLGLTSSGAIFYNRTATDQGDNLQGIIDTEYKVVTNGLVAEISNKYNTTVLNNSGTNNAGVSSWLLFACNASSSSSTVTINGYTKIKLKSFKLWEGDEAVFNLVPCYRKQDNKPGLYDLISNNFLINVNANADFNIGPISFDLVKLSENAKNKTNALYIKECELNTFDWLRDLFWNNQSIKKYLPDDYQEVTYIQSDGSQYIYLDSIIPSPRMTIDARIKATADNTFVLGNGTWDNSNILLHTASSNFSFYFGNTTQNSFSRTPNNFNNVHLSNNEIINNGVRTSKTWGTANLNTGLKFMGGCNNNNKTNSLGYCKIDNNGDKYYLIPCYRKSDSKPGLYDLINDIFYINRGTGEFTIGEDQTIPSYSEEIISAPSSIFKYLTIDLGTSSGNYKDFDMLYRLTVPLQNNTGYGRVNYNQSTNKFLLLNNVPDISGNITIDYRTTDDLAKHSAITAAFPNLTINYSSIYINFEDANIYKGLRNAGLGDNNGISNQQAAAVTTQIPSFQNNTTIITFNELGEYFTGVTAIKDNQFSGCSNLREIDLTNITSLGIAAFYNSSLYNLDVNMPNLIVAGDVTWGNGGYGKFESSRIKSFTAENCTRFGYNTNYPERGGGCFRYCTELVRVNVPACEEFGNTTFEGCTALEEVICPNLKRVRRYAFHNCSSLQSLNTENIESFEWVGAFAGAGFDGKDVSFPKLANLPQVTSNDYNAGYFEGCKFRSFSADICATLGGNTTDRDGGCFENCVNLEEVSVPNCTDIGRNCFWHDTKLKSIYCPNVTIIRYRAFNGCTSLDTIDLSLVTSINAGAFTSTKLGDIEMPLLQSLPSFDSYTYDLGYFYGSGITSFKALSCTNIGSNNQDRRGGCFENCSKLKRVELRDITNITHTSSFRGCSALTTFIIDNETPPTIAANVFSGAPNATFYVPDSAVSTYQAATNWSTYSARIKGLSELPEE